MLRYFTCALLLLPYCSPAQDAPCARYVLAAYQKFMHRYDFGGARPAAHLKMLVEADYRPSARNANSRSTRQVVEAERQGEFLHFHNGNIEVYQSPRELVTIMRDKRVVTITNAALPRQPEFAPALQVMRTYIIEHAPVETCATSSSATGHPQRQVVFSVQQLPQQLPQLAGMQKLTVSIDEKTQAIARFRVLYGADQPLSQVTYTLLEEAPRTSEQPLKPAFSYVLTPGGGLRAEYAAFRLVDQRKR